MLTKRDLMPWRSGSEPPAGGRPGMFHPIETLHRQIDSLFDELWRGFDVTPFGSTASFAGPKVSVSEDDKEIRLDAELPGLGPDDVEVTLVDGRLTVKGEKKAEQSGEANGVHYSERSYGRFERSFAVGAGVDADAISAGFENGVLTVRLPKTETPEAAVKRISIGGGPTGKGKTG